jgi:hypothetical protein
MKLGVAIAIYVVLSLFIFIPLIVFGGFTLSASSLLDNLIDNTLGSDVNATGGVNWIGYITIGLGLAGLAGGGAFVYRQNKQNSPVVKTVPVEEKVEETK